jgi:hypothetical protein
MDRRWLTNWEAVSLGTIRWFEDNLEKVYQANASQLEGIRRKNVLSLFGSCGISLFAPGAGTEAS